VPLLRLCILHSLRLKICAIHGLTLKKPVVPTGMSFTLSALPLTTEGSRAIIHHCKGTVASIVENPKILRLKLAIKQLLSSGLNHEDARVLLPTALGGVTIIDGGGNTGSTTKAPFVSKTAIKFTQFLDQTEVKPGHLDTEELKTCYHQIRASLRRTKEDLPTSQWQGLEDVLNEAIAAAQSKWCGR